MHGAATLMALAFDYWIRGRVAIVTSIVGVILFGSLLYRPLLHETGVPPAGTDAGNAFFFGLYWSSLFAFGAAVAYSLGRPDHRYALPVSSFVLFACPTSCAMLTVLVSYCVTAWVLNLTFDAGWPLLGPALLAAVIVGWYHAVIWSSAHSMGMRIAAVAGSTVLLACVPACEPVREELGAVLFGELSPRHFPMLGIAVAVNLALGAWGVSRQRRGDVVAWGRLLEACIDLVSPESSTSARFASAARAQFWQEWTRRGIVLPCIAASFGLAVVIMSLLVESESGWSYVAGASATAMIPTVVCGIYLGGRSQDGRMGGFEASRPVTSATIASSVMKSTTLAFVASLLVWGVLMAVAAGVWELVGDGTARHGTEDIGGWDRLFVSVVLSLEGTWAALGLMTAITLGGTKWLRWVFFPLVGLTVGGLLVPSFTMHEPARSTVIGVYFSTLVSLSLIAMIGAFAVERARGLVSWPTIAVAAILVAIAVAAVVWLGLPDDGTTRVIVLGLCGLIPACLAVAPLAVWWNRHQ